MYMPISIGYSYVVKYILIFPSLTSMWSWGSYLCFNDSRHHIMSAALSVVDAVIKGEEGIV